jgi:hypothetical protein
MALMMEEKNLQKFTWRESGLSAILMIIRDEDLFGDNELKL